MTPIEIFSATLNFEHHASFKFWALAPTVSWALRQADIVVKSIDLGLSGSSMSFDTDHGRIVLTCVEDGEVGPTVTVSAPVGRGASRETARQICYQLTQRLAAREPVESILWQSALQTIKPSQFKWSALQDVPRWFGVSPQRAAAPGYYGAIA